MEHIEINKLLYDEFNRPYGIFLVDKPKDKTSHDIVDECRKKFKTRKVGHAGTLDPFATGLLIILIGKYTKLSADFLGMDKIYEAEVLFGVQTNSGDIEGEILATQNSAVKKEDLAKTLKTFEPEYFQYVPVFSSVKVGGQKLRILARKAESFALVEIEGEKYINFKDANSEQKVKLPGKTIKLYEIALLSLENADEATKVSISEKLKSDDIKMPNASLRDLNLQIAKVKVHCSSGTYIRQLAIDIGEKISTPAMLVNLRRTKIGEYNLSS